MTEVIYKYGPIYDNQFTEYEGTPVHIGVQGDYDEVYMWCKLVRGTGRYAENPVGKVQVYPTGVPFSGKYIGTAVTRDGFVWHVIGVIE